MSARVRACLGIFLVVLIDEKIELFLMKLWNINADTPTHLGFFRYFIFLMGMAAMAVAHHIYYRYER